MSGYLLPDGSPIDLGTPVRYTKRLERTSKPENRRLREWTPGPVERDGIVTGVRTLWNGEIEWDEGLAFYWTDAIRALVVTWAMHRKPDLVPLDSVVLR